jgi:hypothetical protein
MLNYPFYDEMSLAETAEKLGKQAIEQGLLPSFVVRHYPETKQFFIPDVDTTPLTPEQAYMRLKRLIDQQTKQPIKAK